MGGRIITQNYTYHIDRCKKIKEKRMENVLEITRYKVKLSGVSDIMFDRFYDYSKEQKPPEQKLYLTDGNVCVLPQANIEAFLFGENPQGCAKAFEGKKGKEYIRMGMSHVFIDEAIIPFTDDKEKPIVFNGFKDQFWIHEGSPRSKSGSLSIKQEMKQRPVLRLPWNLTFTFRLIKNTHIDGSKLYNWMVRGGMQIAMGTYRPRWGRFIVTEFEEVKE
jgi:hypothetical protein